MNAQEGSAVVEACLDAVFEQYVNPLLLALGVLTAVISREPEMKKQIADTFGGLAESCPDDVAGRTFLEALADLARGPDAMRDAVRKALRLIPGGVPDESD